MTRQETATTHGLRHEAVGAQKGNTAGSYSFTSRPQRSRDRPEAHFVQRKTSKAQLVESIKNVIVDMVHDAQGLPKFRNSDYISAKLAHDYTYLANLFSEATGSTIEQYIIERKIEWVQQLLLCDELNLTQISYKLNYSSVAHLSHQFKKVTGLTPSSFKHLTQAGRSVPACANNVTLFCNYVKAVKIERVRFALCK